MLPDANQVRIGGRVAGDGAPLFVIAEIGLNHDGSIDRALALVDAAAAAGASAVKVQALVAAELVAPGAPAPMHVEAASLVDFFRRFELDDDGYARLAARHFGADHHEYYVTPDDLVQAIPMVAAHYDQPFGNSSALPAYYCAKMARDDGVHTLLAGDGGDELFGGNSRYAKQRVFGWYEQVPRWVQKGLIESVVERPAAQAVPLFRKAASYVEQAKVPMPDRLQMYNLLLRLTPERVLTPGFLGRIQPQGPLQQQRQVWADSAVTPSWLNRTLAFDWRYTLAESDLPKVMGTAQLAGVAVGFPMLDDGLLDFSLGLPLDYKLKGQHLRWFFKEALRGFLPDEILTKKKQGFGLPFGVWTLRHDGLKQFALASLASLAQRGIVRPDFIDALVKVHLHQHAGYYGEMVWILMMLEQWLAQRAPQFKLET